MIMPNEVCTSAYTNNYYVIENITGRDNLTVASDTIVGITNMTNVEEGQPNLKTILEGLIDSNGKQVYVVDGTYPRHYVEA